MSVDSLKAAFWEVVSDCLVEFHDFDPIRARVEALLLRADLEKPEPRIDPDLMYHSEPFDVAARLAKRDISFVDHRARYERIWRARFDTLTDETVLVPKPRMQPREATA